MKIDVKYGGYTANTSGNDCADGELDCSLNLINEEGALRPVPQPASLFTLASGERLLGVHDTGSEKHYILVLITTSGSTTTAQPKYIKESELSSSSIPRYNIGSALSVGSIYGYTAIGQTICILTDQGIYRYIWSTSGSTSSYMSLGTGFPELDLSFGLKGTMYSDVATYGADVIIRASQQGIPSDYIDSVTNTVLGAVNKQLADVTSDGKFSMPFFVRYAYRLYDGTLTHHSAPILLIPNSGATPYVYITGVTTSGSNVDYGINPIVPSCEIDMACLSDQSIITDLATNYKDIIRSVEIFVSTPFYKYDQSGKVKNFVETSEDMQGDFGLFSLQNASASTSSSTSITGYTKWNIRDAIRAVGYSACYSFELPKKSDETYKENIESCAQFYHVKTLSLSDISTTRSTLNISGDVLNTLTSQELMTDDYDSHDKLIASKSTSYNSRLTLNGISKEMFGGYVNVPHISSMLSGLTFSQPDPTGSTLYYSDDYVTGATDDTHHAIQLDKSYTYIDRDGMHYVLERSLHLQLLPSYASTSYVSSSKALVPYLYHPDSMAIEIKLYGLTSEVARGTRDDLWEVDLKLKQHETLAGSVYFDNLISKAVTQATTRPATTSANVHPFPNKIYLSDVGNPFFFPVSSIVTVGNGNVLAVSSSTQAMSQGQFGEHPLYAFCSDGVWSLQISLTGTISACIPITRDVCINPGGIANLDGVVLFQTDKGLMAVSGSEVRCLSEPIFTEHPFNITTLPSMESTGALPPLIGAPNNTALTIQSFLSFLRTCRIAYDYIRQRVILFNPTVASNALTYKYAYVYSLKSGKWGMMYSKLYYPINDYPNQLCVTYEYADNTETNKVVTFDSLASGSVSCFYVTRPIKLGSPHTLKSIHGIDQYGDFTVQKYTGNPQYGDVKTILWGSRDMTDWFLVGSSKGNFFHNLRGTPYKYFCLAGIATLAHEKSITGSIIDSEERGR